MLKAVIEAARHRSNRACAWRNTDDPASQHIGQPNLEGHIKGSFTNRSEII